MNTSNDILIILQVFQYYVVGGMLGNARASTPQGAHMSHIQSLLLATARAARVASQPCRRPLQSEGLRAA
jgi:hypothetical protein